MLTVRNTTLGNKNVLLVADFNVQIISEHIVSTYKIDQTLPTIHFILESNTNGSLTICSHLGRPKSDTECSMRPVFDYLKDKFPRLTFIKISDLLNENEYTREHNFKLTDNVRYYKNEKLSQLYEKFDLIINDAFGCAHRKTIFSSYAGLLMAKELEELENARHSDLTIMGGAKIIDKLKILESSNSNVFIAGCLSQTIWKSLGFEMGSRSKCEEYDPGNIIRELYLIDSKTRYHDNMIEESVRCESTTTHDECMRYEVPHDECVKYEAKGQGSRKIMLPIDFLVIVHSGGDDEKIYKITNYNKIDEKDECVDIGPKSLKYLEKLVNESTSIFWNGPVGKLEDEKAIGTKQLIKILENSGKSVICGGGETSAAINKYSKIQFLLLVAHGCVFRVPPH